MKKYDPLKAPDSEAWLALDEIDRIGKAAAYHKKAKIKIPKIRLHAAIHATVETQVASGDEMPVSEKLDSLMAEGLDRHEAIHAIGFVLAKLLYDISHEPQEGSDPNDLYYERLADLNVDNWRELL